jgi:hypothetical protein
MALDRHVADEAYTFILRDHAGVVVQFGFSEGSPWRADCAMLSEWETRTLESAKQRSLPRHSRKLRPGVNVKM